MGIIPLDETNCVFCNQHIEIGDHLFIHCGFARELWYWWFALWNLNWVLPASLKDLFLQWNYRTCDVFFKKIWRAVFFIILWTLWKDRNSRIFRKEASSPKQLQEMVLLRLHWWIKGWQETFPYSINDVLQNPMCLKRGSTPRKLKEYHGSSEHQLWRPPPQTALKWNIDASFDPSCNLSAVGGVLRDDSGSFICLFSCPIPPLEINSAEVYAIFRAIKLSISSPAIRNSTFIFESDSANAVKWCNAKDGGPGEKDVVNLYRSNGIGAMRLYGHDLAALQALQGSGIKLMLGVPNGEIASLASDQSAAMQWVKTYVVPFASSIKYIVVGNEIHASDQQAPSVLPALKNVRNALNSNTLTSKIKVSTSIDTTLIINSFPPSKSEFKDTSYITPIIQFLATNESPLLVNIYTYFAYVSNKQSISIEYALFTSTRTVVTDPNNGKNYQNLFDAMVDSVYAALGKVGAPNMVITVSETGWPSGGGDAATVANAGTYYKNLMNQVKKGTPLKPGQAIETYLFAMFDENNKPGANTERHFGLFTPDKTPKYGQLNFS